MLCRENDALVEKLQVSAPGSQPLRFHTRYSTGLLFQVHALDALHALHAPLTRLRSFRLQAHALSPMQHQSSCCTLQPVRCCGM